MDESCPFCEYKQLGNKLVYQSGNFLVFPTLGQITEGYLLIVPKRHVICLGSMTLSELIELEQVRDFIRGKLSAVYDSPTIFFEHGIIGQTIRHAHLHAVPTTIDLFSRLEKNLCACGDGSRWTDYCILQKLEHLRDIYEQNGPYIFYERADGKMFAFEIFRYPQYLRLVLAEELGVSERGNWRQMNRNLDDELIANTIRKLSAVDT